MFKCELGRLPQNFITNIKIDFNKVYLEKSIYEIYKEYKIIPSIEYFIEKNYLLPDKVNLFKDFLNLTFRDVFEYYINSKQYVKDYYHIHQREGEKFAILFNYISKIFIQYYSKSKGNRPKKIKNEHDFNRNENIFSNDFLDLKQKESLNKQNQIFLADSNLLNSEISDTKSNNSKDGLQKQDILIPISISNEIPNLSKKEKIKNFQSKKLFILNKFLKLQKHLKKLFNKIFNE